MSTPQDTITWCECTCSHYRVKKDTVLSRIYLYQRVVVAGKDTWGEVLCMYRYVCILSASCPAWVLPIIHVTASKTWHWGFKMVANLECNIIKSWQRRTSFLMLMWKRVLFVHADGTWIACWEEKKKISASSSLFANADFTSPVLTVARKHSLACSTDGVEERDGTYELKVRL